MQIRMFVFLLVVFVTAGATADDLHHYWDQVCGDCHGHAGDFARRFLAVEDGKLVGQHHKDDLLLFLQNHHLPPDRVTLVHDMLLVQAGTEPRFKEKCGGCHETAAGLARESLVVRDGTLYGKGTDRPVSEFLKRHGRVQAAEIPFFVDLLTRVEHEVHDSR